MKIDFIKQLTAIKKAFLAYAAADSAKVDRNTFEINICRGYLSLRVECEDEDGDTVVFSQEVEMDNNEVYQNSLIPLPIIEEH